MPGIDDRDCGLVACGYRLPLSLRGAKRRGNPFSFRPLRGRAVLCTAGVTDCHAPLGLAMTACFRLVLLLLPVQLPGLVGGVMTPPYRGKGKKKSAFVPSHKETKAQFPLRYHSCSGKSISGARFAVSGGPGVSYCDFRPQLGGDTRSVHITALHLTGSSLKCGGRTDLSSS